MCSQTPRKAAATLFLAAAVTLSCAIPSQASLQPRYTSEGPARSEPGRGFAAFLLQVFDLIGGALDPNGSW